MGGCTAFVMSACWPRWAAVYIQFIARTFCQHAEVHVVSSLGSSPTFENFHRRGFLYLGALLGAGYPRLWGLDIAGGLF